jgi:hypothetical protein
MTLDELRIHFMNEAWEAKTPGDIVKVIKDLPAGADQITDCIVAFCRKKNINPQAQEILEIYKQTEEYKAAQETTEKRSALNREIGGLESILKEYRDNESKGAIPSKEQIDVITERIKKHTANLGSVEGKRRIYTTADYLDECLHYDPSKDFTPALFGGLAFPDGTTSYIGARTARGKTTAMINLAREAILDNRKTIFITLEMSGKQLLNKLILSTAFAMGIAGDKANDPENRRVLMSMDAGRAIYTVWKKRELAGSGANIFRHYVQEAYETVNKAQESGSFILYDGRGSSENEIINFITAKAEKGAVILLDYIQKMPTKSGTESDNYRRVQIISYDVVNAAAETNSIIIAGAQFNRMGGTDGLGDMFDDKSFREAGDIEQDAHNAIGIGWKLDKQSRFYEILKTREDKKQGCIYDIDFCGEYSYMNQGKPTDRQEVGASKGKGKNKTKVYNNNGTYKEVEFNGEEPL